MSNELAVSYKTDNDELVVTANDVRGVLGAPNATDNEVRMFLELCKAQTLNPFIKEAYIIKYGNNPATLVVGKDVFTKRAQKNPKFKGYQAGITFMRDDGKLERREGSMLLPGEHIMGGWCAVYIDGYEKPMKDEVSFQEYAGRKKDGTLNQQWMTKPSTMIRKVAIVHALREAFPDDFQGLYDEAEMGNLEPSLDQEPLKESIVEAEIIESEPVKPAEVKTSEPLDPFAYDDIYDPYLMEEF